VPTAPHFSRRGTDSSPLAAAVGNFVTRQGAWIDGTVAGAERPPCRSDMLLGQRVIGTEVSAPKWFALRFDGGEVLRVFDDSQQFESFSIQPGNIFV
jgi:hypothetical protein